MRRTYLTIGIVAIIVLAAGAYFFFFRGSSSTVPGSAGSTGSLPSVGTQSGGTNGGAGVMTATGETAGSGGTPSAGLPSANGSSKFGIVSDEPVLAYFIDASNNADLVEPDGKIAVVTGGQASFLSSSQVQNVIGAGFSHDGAKVFVNFGDPSAPQTSIFDMSTKAWSPLPAGMTSPAWSPSDNRIAYLESNKNGSISLMTLDVSKATNRPVTLTAFNIEDLTVTWPNKNQIVLLDKPSAYSQGAAYIFDLRRKTMSQVIPLTFGLETAWSNTTSSVALALESPAFGRNGGLSLVDPSSTSTQPLSLQTLPSKCVFNYELPATSTASSAASSTASSTATSTPAAAPPTPYLALYCGVPRSSNDYVTAILPDDYEQMAVYTADDFYRINTDTGDIEQVFSPGVNVDATDLRVMNGVLFFVNRYDQKLYAISLASS